MNGGDVYIAPRSCDTNKAALSLCVHRDIILSRRFTASAAQLPSHLAALEGAIPSYRRNK